MANICTGLLWRLLKAIFFLIVAIALLPLVPNLPPHFSFTSFTIPPPPVLEGKLALNDLLNGAERAFEGEIVGPEGFAVLHGDLYTTLHGGFVAKITNQQIIPVVKFGQSCEGRSEEAKCGRPLGIFAGPDDKLYICDAYYGVFTYDVQSGQKTRLFSRDDVIGDRKGKLFNSITVAADGTIYWTDSSSDVELEDGLYSMLADGTGRLIKYDPKRNKHTVLIDNLLFANGVALAPDESFVVVAETGMSRVHRYWLKGAKAGSSDLFIDRLPGMPDNLRAGTDGFLVSLILAGDSTTPILGQALFPFPYIRKALARALYLPELALKKIHEHYPNEFCKNAIHSLGHFEMTKPFSPLRVTLLALDTTGNVIDSFHALDGSVHSISDAIVHRGVLYLGSPYNNYLGRVKNPDVVARFTKAFATPLKVTVRVKATEPPTVTSTPKPTTTTPKPTTTPQPTTTPKPTTTQKPTTTTPKPTTTQKPTTTTPKPTTTQKPTTTTPKPTTTQKPTTTTAQKPTTSQKPTTTTPKPTTAKPSKARGSDEL